MRTSIVITIISISFILSSCAESYFSEPQPLDVKNITKLPKKYTGVWLLGDSSSRSLLTKDSLIVSERFYKMFNKFQFKESIQKIESDSNSFLIEDKLYVIEDGNLKGGFDYEIKSDSIIADVEEVTLVEFGETTFLRKIDQGYILNLEVEASPGWWKLKFIDTRRKDGIVIRELGKEEQSKPHSKPLSEELNNYFVSGWSKAAMEKYIDSGGFADTLIYLKFNERIKLK
ncbi:MAG: hypothetical protein AB8B53_06465 [Flavobacteriales bacterium]